MVRIRGIGKTTASIPRDRRLTLVLGTVNRAPLTRRPKTRTGYRLTLILGTANGFQRSGGPRTRRTSHRSHDAVKLISTTPARDLD